MNDMQAIVISHYGEPEVLVQARVPMPEPTAETVILRVRAFGLNHAEAYFRRGAWGDVAKVSGIECVGEVHDPGSSRLRRGQRALALLGGMGRTLNGSYAEYVRVPESNVVAIDSPLEWPTFAALPESYATAWVFLTETLALAPGQSLVIRGGTSALGQAAINIARQLGARVLATSRSKDKARIIEVLGAEPIVETPELVAQIRERFPDGVDAVLDIVGTRTLPGSLQLARYGGRVALAGFLGGGEPLQLNPLTDMPSGVQLSFMASAFVFGTATVPLSRIPFADMVRSAERGEYQAKPAHVFSFAQIVEAHRLMESGDARGKIVVLGI
jgi:NADPH:quinone reductase-like Zn-dependent oxidoreductase